MEIETKDYSYKEYVVLRNRARRESFKLIIHGVCKECGNAFTKMHTDEEGYAQSVKQRKIKLKNMVQLKMRKNID